MTGASGSARGAAARRRTPTPSRYGEPRLVRRPERQNLPPRLSGRLRASRPERYASSAEPPVRQRRRMEQDSAERACQLHRFDSCRSSKLPAACHSQRREPRRGSRSSGSCPQVDCGRYPVKRTAGRPRRSHRRRSSATATRRSAPRSATSPRVRPAGSRRRSSRSATTGWAGAFVVDRYGRW